MPTRRAEPRSLVSHALELENIEPGIGIGEIHQPVAIDVAIAGLDDLRPVRARIHHARRIGRHEVADLARLVLVIDVVGAHPRIV